MDVHGSKLGLDPIVSPQGPFQIFMSLQSETKKVLELISPPPLFDFLFILYTFYYTKNN